MMFVLLLALAQISPGTRSEPCTPQTLVGTWRVVEVDGQSRPDDYPVHKHVTLTHFAVIEWNPGDNDHTVRVHAGPYTASGDKYHESIVYGSGPRYDQLPADRRRAGLNWSCSRTGDDWWIEGAYEGQTRRETWRRVAPSR